MKTPSTLAAPPAAPVGMERRFGVADVLRKLGVQTRPPRCGRYELLEKLGEGGMGSVFRARDPKLGRDVAIKLLREDADPDARRWLRREAQALARLNDPRVVTALAVGEEQAQTWIAMELVQGQTLGQWAEASDRNKPRFRRRALALLREAGLGIAAAHRRGLVHRDVKPANILIGDDGQVKVADFGLARINVSAAASMVTQSGSENDQESRVTAAYAGTPRYMAPEQHMGQGADARSDQYAFAVTAWEVLTGEPPFRGNTMIALAESKFDDDVAPGDDLPRELRHALHKAMRAASKDRFGDMDELLTALARRPRRGKVWAIPTVALAGLAAWALLDTSPPKHPCADLIPPQWGATEQAALNASFVGSEDLRAPQAWQAIDSDLDEYVATWARERDQICAATPPSPPRVRCLERSAQVFGQVLETAGERPALARSREALLSAMPTVDCNSTTRDQTPAHEEIEGALAKAAILRVAGRRDEERRVLEALEPKVRRLGDPSELTRFLSTLGASYSNLGRPDEAAATLAEAHAVAVENHDDARALDVSVEAIEAMLETGAPPSATRTWIEHAKVAHARLGEPENTDAVWMFVREAELARAQEQPERALEIQHHALAIAIGLDATSSGVYQARAVAHQSLADVYLRQSDLDLAEEHVHAIIENYAAALGADHPRTLDMHSYLGDLHYGRERFEQAAQAYETAVAGARVVFGPKSASMSIVLGKVARVHRALGQYERGIEVATQALEVAEAVNPNSRFVSEALSELGLSQQLAGQLSAARSTTQRALTIIEENQGSDAFDMAPVLHDLGEIAFALGDDEAASRNLLRSIEIAEAYLGPDGVNLAYPLAALARVRARQGDEAAAASLRARARALAVDHPDPALRAELQLEP